MRQVCVDVQQRTIVHFFGRADSALWKCVFGLTVFPIGKIVIKNQLRAKS